MACAEAADKTLKTQRVLFHSFYFARFAPNFCALCVGPSFWIFPFYNASCYEQRYFKTLARAGMD